jgi:alpha-L-fucosidase
VLNDQTNQVTLPQFPHKKIKKAYLLKDNSKVETRLIKDEALITVNADHNEADRVIVLEI